MFSCSTTKHIKYFEDLPDSGQMKTIPAQVYNEPRIQVDDIMTIMVQTIDPSATSMINLNNAAVGTVPSTISSTSATLPQQPQMSGGYLVDKRGEVQIPILGTIKLLGLTTSEARDTIKTIAAKYFKNPSIIVRYANFKISVTGEVLKPGQYIVPNEKISILDAIAMAGDLNIFGKRDNVLLIRENLDGTKTTYRYNLNKSDIMSSPYYYLRQNDIIYVEPGKGKAAANDLSQARTFALISSILTVLIVLASRIN